MLAILFLAKSVVNDQDILIDSLFLFACHANTSLSISSIVGILLRRHWRLTEENSISAILVRDETSPEDVDGMHASKAILTSKGGMTSHAALVARGWGKCCIVGCNDIEISSENGTLKSRSGKILYEGDWISLNGTTGLVYEGAMPLVSVNVDENESYKGLMKLVDETKQMEVRANVETPENALHAIHFGATGIGLFRTEHMFYGENSEEHLFLLRKMIVSDTEEERCKALNELAVYVKKDIKSTMEVMDGYSVTIRLLDPPLHEFVPVCITNCTKCAV